MKETFFSPLKRIDNSSIDPFFEKSLPLILYSEINYNKEVWQHRNFRDEDETNLDWQSDFNEEARERERGHGCVKRAMHFPRFFMIFNASWKES